MSDIFYTSDLHFDDPKVAKFRGFGTVKAHDRHIARIWAEQVRPIDTVWVLGDLTASSSSVRIERVLDDIRDLPGTKHLIAGNHDQCWPGIRASAKWQARYLKVFASVQPFARHRIDGSSVMLSHFPYRGDHTDTDRHIGYRLRNDGLPIIHGHTHSDRKWTFDGMTPQIHVGWDAWDGLVQRPVIAHILSQIERRQAERAQVPLEVLAP